MSGLIRRLEQLGADTWPAEAVEEVRGWRLGFTRGVTRRANSVLPLDWAGDDPVAAVAEVEARYRGRGLTPCFKLTAAARPDGLDDLLAGRGYRICGRTRAMTADAAAVVDSVTGGAVRLAGDPDPVWRATAWPPGEVPAGEEAVRAGIVARIQAPRAFATVLVGELPAGAALGAVVGEWACITAVHTLPAFRRRGVARSALTRLAGWAVEHRAAKLFLQVEAENAPAIALYESAGFRRAYDYHYRTL